MSEGAGGLAGWRARIAAEKRAAILEAARAAFLAGGYGHTTLEAVAKAAGVSTGTLFKHFPTKAALFGAIVERAFENEPGAVPAMPPAGDPRQGLLAIGRAYARLLRAAGTVPLFRVVIAEAVRFPELGETLYARGKAPYLERLERYVADEAAAGTLAVPPDGRAMAVREFLGMINDQLFWPHLLLVELAVPDAEAERVVESAVETFLARHAPPPAG